MHQMWKLNSPSPVRPETCLLAIGVNPDAGFDDRYPGSGASSSRHPSVWALRRRDRDPTRSTLAIRRSLEEVKGKLIVGETKTGVGRVITLTRSLSSEFAKRCAQLPDDPNALILGNRMGPVPSLPKLHA